MKFEEYQNPYVDQATSELRVARNVPFDQDRHDSSVFIPDDSTAIPREISFTDNIGNATPITKGREYREKKIGLIADEPAKFDITTRAEVVESDPVSIETPYLDLPAESRKRSIRRLVNKALFGVEDPVGTRAHRKDTSGVPLLYDAPIRQDKKFSAGRLDKQRDSIINAKKIPATHYLEGKTYPGEIPN